MPQSHKRQIGHNSPISRRVHVHPRNEVKRMNKLDRISSLYDDKTGMLNSQLTDTQWAVNIGLEATQDNTFYTSTPVKAESYAPHQLLPPLMDRKSRASVTAVKKEEPSSPLLYRLSANPLQDLPPIYHLLGSPVNTPSSSILRSDSPLKAPLFDIKHEHSLQNTSHHLQRDLHLQHNLQRDVLQDSSQDQMATTLVEANVGPVSQEAHALTYQMVVTYAERKVIESIRALVEEERAEHVEEVVGIKSDRDIFRLELENREQYIVQLREMLTDKGVTPPSSPFLASQKNALHF
ncbi:hypothetical protein FB446DRAFT_792489 [Lentinula raphanica]|nr:hypothetical protein FB446DRAFT_792489 [Lentinula raphanica]